MNGTKSDSEEPPKLVKRLFGVPNGRGGTTWLDKCPDYLKSSTGSPDHALVVRFQEDRSETSDKKLKLSSISIQSPYLRQVVRDIFKSYPGETIDQEDLSFDAPFHPFFHRWATLTAHYEKAKQEDDGEAEEIGALISILDDEFGEDMRNARNLAKHGNMTFRLLWTMYPPGCPVFGQWKGKPHCFLVNEAKYLMAEIVPTLALDLILLDHDGERYGWRNMGISIPAFDGSIRIPSLPTAPIHFHNDAQAFLESAYSRGALAVDMIQNAPAYKEYEGNVGLHKSFTSEEIRVYVEGRIMIDMKSHSQQANRYSPHVTTQPRKLECLLSRDMYTKTVNLNDKQGQNDGFLSVSEDLSKHPVLSIGHKDFKESQTAKHADQPSLARQRWTEDLLGIRPEAFCRSAVRGYCLTSKSWAEFEVENIHEIQWSGGAFDALVIPPARKRLLEALVRQQQTFKMDVELDDVIKGKGQGLIMLLTGPPGTGKTLTAESISERLQLPLYSVNSTELGDTAQEIESHFGHVLRLAASWNAVLLLDEADAFLEKRVDKSEARDQNKRVAAFLRILEYYRGILILTTNQVVNFDDAFYSRIHLTLPFKPLDQTSRQTIWSNFLRGADISASELSAFASENLNGRQIKNIMKMARLLAKDEGAPLRANHISDVLMVMREDIDQRR